MEWCTYKTRKLPQGELTGQLPMKGSVGETLF